jgi:hypothetical protein
MSLPWIRLYTNVPHNPKVQRLTGPMFKFWINCLCLAGQSDGVLPKVEDLAFILGIERRVAVKWTETLCELGVIDLENGQLKPHDWDSLQYVSDVSTQRVRKFREAKRNVSGNVSETVQIQIQKQKQNNPLQSPKGDVSAEGSAKLVAKAEAVAERSDIAGKQFAEFWSASWKRGSKAQAEKSFRRIVASAGFGSLLASVVKFAEAYATVPEDKRPHVATWLNQRRYEQPVTDFVAAPGNDPASGSDDWVNWLANLPPN